MPLKVRRDAILEGARLTPGNMCTYTICIDNGLIVSESAKRFLFPCEGALQEISEKYCSR